MSFMKRKLFLITERFPYGNDEKSFIMPELPYLAEEYDLTIISCADKRLPEEEEPIKRVNPNINIIIYERKKETIFLMLSFWRKVITSSIVGKEIVRLKKKNLRIIYYVVLYYIRARLFAEWLYSALDQEDLENGIFYSYWAYTQLFGLVLLKEKYPNMKIITRIHGFDLYNDRSPIKYQPYKIFMDKAVQYFVFIAQKGKEYYCRTYVEEANEQKYQVCKLGIQGGNCIGEHGKTETFHIVSCSKIIPIKRVDLLIKGLALISDIKIKWTHFGSGNDIEKMELLASELLGENISFEFKGYVSNEDIMSYYRTNSIDCFITTSSTEGCPVSIMEALSFGIPIVGTAVGEIPLMIDGNGILLSENPSEQMVADAIRKIFQIRLTQEYTEMCERSLELWRKEYDIKKNVVKFMHILSKLKEM